MQNLGNSLIILFCFSECNDIMDGHIFRVFAMQHNPNHPHVFISGGWDDTVQVCVCVCVCVCVSLCLCLCVCVC